MRRSRGSQTLFNRLLKEMNNKQRQFGNHGFDPLNSQNRANTPQRIKTFLHKAGDEVKLINWDTITNPFEVLIASCPNHTYHADRAWVDQVKELLAQKEPEGNPWDAYIMTRKNDRVQTINNKTKRMNMWLVHNGYYSPSYKPTVRKYGLSKAREDGVSKANLILSEDEIATISNFVFPNWKQGGIAYEMQTALDIMTMAIWYGARKNDVRTIIKSTDNKGLPVAAFGNTKSRKVQEVAWDPATEGARLRGLYQKVKPESRHDRALRRALRLILPEASDRMVKYFVYRPASGRVLLDDHRLSHIGFHSGRHTCAVRWLNWGMNLQTVSKLMGHSSVMITGKYYAYFSQDDNNDILRQAKGQLAPKVFGESISIPVLNKLKQMKEPKEPIRLKKYVEPRNLKQEAKQRKKANLLRVIKEINEQDGANLHYGAAIPKKISKYTND